MLGITSVLWENSFSTMEVAQCVEGFHQYCRNSFSTVKAPQWTGGIASVQQNDSLSTMEIVQYSGGIKSECGRTTSVLAGG